MQAFCLAYHIIAKTTKGYLAKLDLDDLLKVTSQGDKRIILPVLSIYLSDVEDIIYFIGYNRRFI